MYQELKEETDRLYGKNEELKERTEELVKMLDDIMQRIEKQIHNIEGFPEEYLHAVEKITHRWINPNSGEEKLKKIAKMPQLIESNISLGGMRKSHKEDERQNDKLKQEEKMIKEQYQSSISSYENEMERYVALRGLLTLLTFLAIDEKNYDEFDEDVRNLIEYYFGKLDEVETAMSWEE